MTNIWFFNGGIFFFKDKHPKTESVLKCCKLFFAIFLIEAIKIQKSVEIISIRYKILKEYNIVIKSKKSSDRYSL